MKSDTDLDLVFKNAIGKKVTLNIEEPKCYRIGGCGWTFPKYLVLLRISVSLWC